MNTIDQAIIDQALADLTELIDLVNVKVNIDAYKNLPEGIDHRRPHLELRPDQRRQRLPARRRRARRCSGSGTRPPASTW